MAAKFSTHHIPDEGIQFVPGDVVSLIHRPAVAGAGWSY
jgi:hypothetical protein